MGTQLRPKLPTLSSHVSRADARPHCCFPTPRSPAADKRALSQSNEKIRRTRLRWRVVHLRGALGALPKRSRGRSTSSCPTVVAIVRLCAGLHRRSPASRRNLNYHDPMRHPALSKMWNASCLGYRCHYKRTTTPNADGTLPKLPRVVEPPSAGTHAIPLRTLPRLGLAFKLCEALTVHLGHKAAIFRKSFSRLAAIGTITDIFLS